MEGFFGEPDGTIGRARVFSLRFTTGTGRSSCCMTWSQAKKSLEAGGIQIQPPRASDWIDSSQDA